MLYTQKWPAGIPEERGLVGFGGGEIGGLSAGMASILLGSWPWLQSIARGSCENKPSLSIICAAESPVDEGGIPTKYNARNDELYWNQKASTALKQCEAQNYEEVRRMTEAHGFIDGHNRFNSQATDRVRERWIEQGIWDHK